MFCSTCGKQTAPDGRFCSSCGAVVAAQPAFGPGSQPLAQSRTRIVRPLAPRMVAGICSGVAIHYGWDLALTRILFSVFTVLTSGLGLLCYLIAWIVLPEAPFALPAVGMVYPAQGTAQPATQSPIQSSVQPPVQPVAQPPSANGFAQGQRSGVA